MYKKLIHIKNYGRFVNYTSKASDWDGSFQKINIVYAPNGSGKTSLAELFKSTTGDDDVIAKKQTFGITQSPDIKFILDDGKELKFNGSWNKNVANVDVFDSFYFEDNLYAISIYDDPQRPNIFELAISEEITSIKTKILTLKAEKSSISHTISNRKNYLRRNLKSSKSLVFCPKDIFLKRLLVVSNIYICKLATVILLKVNILRRKKLKI